MFQFLASGLVDFVEMLQMMSENEAIAASTSNLDGFFKMQVRLNDVQTIYAGFENFKMRCIGM